MVKRTLVLEDLGMLEKHEERKLRVALSSGSGRTDEFGPWVNLVFKEPGDVEYKSQEIEIRLSAMDAAELADVIRDHVRLVQRGT